MTKRRTPENRRKTGVKRLRGGVDPKVGEATRFRPGVSPNPGGRPKTRPIMEAMQNAIVENPNLLKQLARQALQKAKSSHRWFREVRDTLDGRPVLAVANLEGEKFQVEVTSARDKLLAAFARMNDARQDP